VDVIQRKAAHALVDGVTHREVKQHLLMGGDRSLNEALHQVMKAEAVKAAAGTMRGVARIPMERGHQSNTAGIDDRCASSVGTSVTSVQTIDGDPERRSSLIKTGEKIVQREGASTKRETPAPT
jgi:hypothetical protein